MVSCPSDLLIRQRPALSLSVRYGMHSLAGQPQVPVFSFNFFPSYVPKKKLKYDQFSKAFPLSMYSRTCCLISSWPSTISMVTTSLFCLEDQVSYRLQSHVNLHVQWKHRSLVCSDARVPNGNH